jgi:cysteine desulfurase/selenocysteine lyase
MEILTELYPIETIRDDFPILHQDVNGKPLIYFDNAATTQKPFQVVEALTHYYLDINANIHRGIHTLAEKSTSEFEATREEVRKFLNASSADEIIFTKGVTDGINLVANGFAKSILKPGDEVVISAMEHHSNIVPWQMACEQTGAQLKVVPINDAGEFLFEEFSKLLNEKTKIVSIVHVSNALGTINPAKEIVAKAHSMGIPVLLDGAQSSSHLDIDVQDLDCDFFALSAHKVYGPTGVGVLYGKRAWLDKLPPYQGGGEMIKEVTFAKTTYNELPYKFEAGTPNIGGVVAFKASLEYINQLGKSSIAAYEDELLSYATEQLLGISGLKIIGSAKEKISVASFIIEGVHHQDLGVILDQQGVAVRTGHHCTQPLMNRMGILGTTRASFAMYNTKEEINQFIIALNKAVKMLR